jgi:predicted dehydrogenase
MPQSLDRRDFLRIAGIAGTSLMVGSSQFAKAEPTTRPREAGAPLMCTFAAPKLDVVRVGVVGVGKRGPAHVTNLLKLDRVEVKAICDLDPAHATSAGELVTKAGKPTPALYTNGDHDFERMNDRDDLDLIVNATPWDWHVPIALDAMRKGKHAFIEVPAATTVDDCWALVETSEKTRRHCVMMENCCYGGSELMVLNMCRAGLFGELLHGEAAYLHYLVANKFGGKDDLNGRWRLQPSKKFNGNMYPTHGLGPVAQYMGINRGDRFDYLVSMSSPSRGINLKAAELFGPDDPRAKFHYALGDMNTSIIKTASGRTIMLQHDTSNPRPYSRINTIVGTKGLFCGYPDRIAFTDSWADLAPLAAKYEHPLWTKHKANALNGGHGGMDYVMMARLIDCLHNGLPMDMCVYDAAAWSCIVELSIRSVANRSAAAEFPDFTLGAWRTSEPLGIVS